MAEECQHAIPEVPTGVTLIEHSDWDVSAYVQRLLKELDRSFAAVELYSKQIYRKRMELGRAQGDLADAVARGASKYAVLAKELQEL
jgi:hypothetical protein